MHAHRFHHFSTASRLLASRSAGAVDKTDLLIGIVLLVIVPFLVFLGGAFLDKGGPPDPRLALNRSESANIPLDAEEVEIQWQLLDKAYRTNAKPMVRRAEEAQDDILRDRLRSWARKTVEKCKSDLAWLESKSLPQFSDYAQRFQLLKNDIESDIKTLKGMDILGRDG